jgi:hypothetical protein
MKRGKIILKKESKPEQKNHTKNPPSLTTNSKKNITSPRDPGSAAGKPPETASRRRRECRIA